MCTDKQRLSLVQRWYVCVMLQQESCCQRLAIFHHSLGVQLSCSMCRVTDTVVVLAAVESADTITAANEAHAAKEKALAEVSALKLAAEREHATFEEEWRQLTHLIEEDR